MKNLLILVFAFVFIMPACSIEKNSLISAVENNITPNDSESVELTSNYQVDTIITFDAETFEEKITNIITYQVDTIITFDPNTNIEEIQLVKTIISNQTY